MTRLPPGYAYQADSNEALFVERALLYVETETYNTLFPPLEGLMYVPLDTSSPEGAKFTTYKQYTRTGIAKLVTERGMDLPTSKLFVKEYSHQFYRLGMAYEYTLDDLLAAQFSATTGGPALNIDTEQAIAAREAINKALDAICGVGSASSNGSGLGNGIGPDVGMLGILNQPNATSYTIATGAAGSSAWSQKTPDEKVADLTGIYAAMVASTFKIFVPDTILLPIAQYEIANATRMGDGSDSTVIEFYKRTKPNVTVASWQYCATSGATSQDRMIAYINNKRYVRHMISQMFRQLPAQFENFTFTVLCTAKTAGVVCPYPLSISYGDGI